MSCFLGAKAQLAAVLAELRLFAGVAQEAAEPLLEARLQLKATLRDPGFNPARREMATFALKELDDVTQSFRSVSKQVARRMVECVIHLLQAASMEECKEVGGDAGPMVAHHAPYTRPCTLTRTHACTHAHAPRPKALKLTLIFTLNLTTLFRSIDIHNRQKSSSLENPEFLDF